MRVWKLLCRSILPPRLSLGICGIMLAIGTLGCFDEFNLPPCTTLADCPAGSIACHESGQCVLANATDNSTEDVSSSEESDTTDSLGSPDAADAAVHELACDSTEISDEHCMAFTRDLTEHFEQGAVSSETAFGHGSILIAGRSSLGGRVLAIAPESGEINWVYDKDEESLRCPMAIPSGGIVTTNTGHVYGMSPQGEKLWSFDTGGIIVGCPAAWSDGQRLFVAVHRGDGEGVLVTLETTWDPEDASVTSLGEAPLDSIPVASPTTTALEGITGVDQSLSEDPRIVVTPTALGYQIHHASSGEPLGGDTLKGAPLHEVALSGNISWGLVENLETDGTKRHWMSQTTFIPGGDSADGVVKLSIELGFTPASSPILLGEGGSLRMVLVSQSGSLHLMPFLPAEEAQTGTSWSIGSELTGVAITANEEILTLDQTDGELRAYAPDGELSWSASLTGGKGLGNAAMNVIPGQVIVTTENGELLAWRAGDLEGLSTTAPWPRWRGGAAALGGN